MNSAAVIAQTGLSAATLWLDSAGHNIANALTPQFRRQQVAQQTLPDGGVLASTTIASEIGSDLATDLVNQMTALYTFKANLQTIKVQDSMLGSLLDTRA